MSSSFRPGLFFCAALLATGCSRGRHSGPLRLAIAPFENLTDDPSPGWAGRAAMEVVAYDLEGARGAHSVRLSSRWEAARSGATRALDGYFTSRNGRLSLRVTVEELSTNRTVDSISVDGAAADGILPLADAVARRLDTQARPFCTRSEQALEAYAKALTATDAPAATAGFERARDADPDFAPVYLAWGEFLLSRGDAAGASNVLARATERAGKFAELDRLKLELLETTLRGDATRKARVLLALARKMPADLDVALAAARALVRSHEFASAADWYRKVAAADTVNPLVWNELGYAAAYGRNLEGARRALQEYAKLSPSEANPLDSLGDVHYYLGRFTEAAEFYLQAYRRNVAFLGGGDLYKAARARWMARDVAGAEELFRRFIEQRKAAGDPLLAYREAQWRYSMGKRQEAIAQLAVFAAGSKSPDAVALADCQLAAWLLYAGDRARARQHARRAVAAAGAPVYRNLALFCRHVVDPAASPPAGADERTRKSAAAYSLLFDGRFHEASKLLAELYATEDPVSGEGWSAPLAWALIETGRQGEARPLLEIHPVPKPGGEPVFFFLNSSLGK